MSINQRIQAPVEDTEGDGIWDAFESLNGLASDNPADTLLDIDGDGLTNLEESRMSTNSFNADSDADGYPDNLDADPSDAIVRAIPVPLFSAIVLLVLVMLDVLIAARRLRMRSIRLPSMVRSGQKDVSGI